VSDNRHNVRVIMYKEELLSSLSNNNSTFVDANSVNNTNNYSNSNNDSNASGNNHKNYVEEVEQVKREREKDLSSVNANTILSYFSIFVLLLLPLLFSRKNQKYLILIPHLSLLKNVKKNTTTPKTRKRQLILKKILRIQSVAKRKAGQMQLLSILLT
jgi:hypothetical protein